MSNCIVRYFYNGREERLISPEVADLIEEQARKQRWLVERTPFLLSIKYVDGASDLW
jgi:hypothetical protein